MATNLKEKQQERKKKCDSIQFVATMIKVKILYNGIAIERERDTRIFFLFFFHNFIISSYYHVNVCEKVKNRRDPATDKKDGRN